MTDADPRIPAAEGLFHRYTSVAARYPDLPALVTAEAVLTHGHLWVVARSFARKMGTLGVTESSVVALTTSDPFLSLGILLASALIGCQLVMAGPNLAMTKALRPTHFLRSDEMAEGRLNHFELIDPTWWPAESDPVRIDTADLPTVDPDAPWLAQHTSGTTGLPKYLTLSQRVVLDRTAAIAADFPTAATTIAMLFGCTTRPFQARAIGALLNACTIVSGHDIGLWRQWGVNYVCGSPLQAADFFRDKPKGHKFARIETSGGSLSDADALVLLDHFHRVIDIYGASETNKTFATLIRPGPNGLVQRIGQPLDSRIEIVDRDGMPVPAGATGLVRVRNGYMAPGYIGAPEKTAAAFRDGWFYPGDIATWTEDGALSIIGREDDVISIGGIKTNAGLLDLIIKVVPGVQDAICFKNPKAAATEQLTAFVCFAPLSNRVAVIEEIQRSISDKFSVLLPMGNVHSIDKIPRDENGKPQRALAQQMILAKVQQMAAEQAAASAQT